MLTIDALKKFGCDTDDGLTRCMGNEAFYFKLIGKVIDDKNFQALGNLALTPVYEPVFEITELLRERKDIDYSGYLKTISEKRSELAALLA